MTSAGCLGLPTTARKTHSKWMSLMRRPFETCMRRQSQRKQPLALQGTGCKCTSKCHNRHHKVYSCQVHNRKRQRHSVRRSSDRPVLATWTGLSSAHPQAQPLASTKHRQGRASSVAVNGYAGVTPAASAWLMV